MDARGRDVAIVVAKMAYEVSQEGAVRRVLSSVRRAEQRDEAGGLAFPNEVEAHEKPGTDVGLIGMACPPRAANTRTAYAWLTVGSIRKVVLVYGPRVYVKGWRGVVPSDPAPLVHPVPLRFDHAFGGTDPITGAADPTNPVGRGFASDPDRLVGEPAHALEPAPEGGTPPPPSHATFAPIPANWEPRRSLAGTNDHAWARSRAPVRPRDFDPRHFNWSVRGLHSQAPLLGDEQVEIGGVRPEGVWRFRLPRYAVTIESITDGLHASHPTHLDTFFVDAERRLVELVWRAAIPLPRKWERLSRIAVLGAGELPEEVILGPRQTPHHPAASDDARGAA